MAGGSLIDPFGRRITYLRISVTDRCDFRCVYCMEETTRFVAREQVLTLEEIVQVARAFCELGTDKIRITGGEPLLRRNIIWLFQQLGQLPGLRELVLTTNASQLEKYAVPLYQAGVRRINISLDTLQAERFKQITRSGKLEQVLAGIEAARAAGFERLKLNSVALKNYNDDEIQDLVQFAVDRAMDITFIEEMPLGHMNGHDRELARYPADELRHDLEPHFRLVSSDDDTGGPARYFRIPATQTRVGFIAPHSHNFCATCNRVRLTPEGRLLLCLGQEHSADLRQVLRDPDADAATLKQAIIEAAKLKPEGHEFNSGEQPLVARYMNMTGG